MAGEKILAGRTLYIPRMSYEGARCLAAAFQSIGIDATVAPEDDAHSFELARRYLSGDECLPESITLGSFLKVTEAKDYDPEKTAFMMPTSNGPCRFGHYLPLARKVFEKRGEDVLLVSPTSANGYKDIGKGAQELIRTAWRAVIVSDITRKMLLKTRPYEIEKGMTDRFYHVALDRVCEALALSGVSHQKRMEEILIALTAVRDAFRAIPVDRSRKKLLIGVVGEIFCRLNDFSNAHLIRLIEKNGGEAWMSDVAEWVWYTNDEEEKNLIRAGRRYSLGMFGCRMRQRIMRHDEQRMVSLFREEFFDYPEPHHITQVLDLSRPYLPREGAHGEMVISAGRALWFQRHGAAGVIDISPFTCMNGIVCESVYPRMSKQFDGFPIRVFYFDGLQSQFDNDVEIFMELARNYDRTKTRREGTEG
jgi:predicted nucleotide-binding protein (sugar kinase/HSP70/actin superfamily)